MTFKARSGPVAAGIPRAPSAPPRPSSVIDEKGPREMNVVVVGMTGSGKSTFMNTFHNYFSERDIHTISAIIPTQYYPMEERLLPNGGVLTHTERAGDFMGSQTDGCTAYTYPIRYRDPHGSGLLPSSFNLYDTPGFGDTRGIEQDKENLLKILGAMSKFGTISGIIVVINGREARLHTVIKASLETLKGNIPDRLRDNVIVVFTNCNRITRNFQMASLYEYFTPSEDKVFYMDNSAFGSDPSSRVEEEMNQVLTDWANSIRTCSKIHQCLTQMDALPAADIEIILEARDRMRGYMHEALGDFGNVQKVAKELENLQRLIQQQKVDRQTASNYTATVMVEVPEEVPANQNSTICMSCSHMCHEPCYLNEIPDKGSTAFRGCACMGGTSNCRRCTGQCDHTHHYHARKKVMKVQKPVERVIEDLKRKYDLLDSNIQSRTSELAGVTATINGIRHCITGLAAKLRNECESIQNICSHFNFVAELALLREQLRREAERMTTTQARDIAQQFIDGVSDLMNEFSRFPTPVQSP